LWLKCVFQSAGKWLRIIEKQAVSLVAILTATHRFHSLSLILASSSKPRFPTYLAEHLNASSRASRIPSASGAGVLLELLDVAGPLLMFSVWALDVSIAPAGRFFDAALPAARVGNSAFSNSSRSA
jgi:hypothetical protein